MQIKFMIFVLSFFLSSSIVSQASVPRASNNPGNRLLNYHLSLKEAFPKAERFKEDSIIPEENGGHTFMGLVNRLLGTGVNEKFEGRLVKRYMYKAIKDDQIIGIAHGSSYAHKGDDFGVVVYYSDRGHILNIQSTGLPEHIAAELEKENYFEQFKGYLPEDFHYTYYRKNRRLRKRAGKFLSSVKKPKSSAARKYSDSILRSVRFNTAFMDVAYFITKHPDLDSKSTKIKQNQAKSGPEIHVKDSRVSSPLSRDSKSVIMQE